MADESWAAARQIAEHQGWLLTAGQARQVGLAPHQLGAQLRSGSLVALLRGVYLVDADMAADITPETWCRAALLAHGPDAFLVGRSAARTHGAEGLTASDAFVDVALAGGVSRHPREVEAPGRPIDGPLVIVRQWPLPAEEIVDVAGLRVREAGASVVDAALLLDRVHALCLFDWALRAGVLTPERLDSLLARARRRPGVVHARAMAAIADGRAGSPLESRVRLACIDGSLRPDELQYPVRNRWEVVVAIGDLAWLRRRSRPLIGEADGEQVHSLPAAVLHDRRRTNALVAESCDVVRFTWSDALRPVYIQQVVRAALAS
jgi:hypothetical protein